MKTIIPLRGIITAIISSCACLPLLAQLTLKDHIIWAHADGRGEIITTQLGGGMVSFWSLADGKLIEKMYDGDVQMPIRTMRYKLQNGAYLESGFAEKYMDTPDSAVCVLSTNGEFTVRIAHAKNDQVNWVRNRATHIIAVYGVKVGVATILLVDANDPTDVSGMLKGRLLPAYARTDFNFKLEFSPKGGWLIDRNLRIIINTQSGKIVSFADGVGKDDEFEFLLVFSPDEKFVALGIKGYGMKAFETETGKIAGSYPLPKRLRLLKGREVYPASDCKSYIYTGTLTSESMDIIVQDAFLVKGNEVIELKE